MQDIYKSCLYILRGHDIQNWVKRGSLWVWASERWGEGESCKYCWISNRGTIKAILKDYGYLLEEDIHFVSTSTIGLDATIPGTMGCSGCSSIWSAGRPATPWGWCLRLALEVESLGNSCSVLTHIPISLEYAFEDNVLKYNFYECLYWTDVRKRGWQRRVLPWQTRNQTNMN